MDATPQEVADPGFEMKSMPQQVLKLVFYSLRCLFTDSNTQTKKFQAKNGSKVFGNECTDAHSTLWLGT